MIAVAFGGGLAPVLLVLALDRTPAGTVSLLLNLELVATAIIARVFLQEQIGRRAGLGIVIVVLGGVILAGTAEAGVAVGAVLVAATCVCWGIDNAITASLDSYSPSQITLVKGMVAGSVNLALGLLLTGAPARSSSQPSRSGRWATACRSRCGSPAPDWSERRVVKSSSHSPHSSERFSHGPSTATGPRRPLSSRSRCLWSACSWSRRAITSTPIATNRSNMRIPSTRAIHTTDRMRSRCSPAQRTAIYLCVTTTSTSRTSTTVTRTDRSYAIAALASAIGLCLKPFHVA